MKDPTYGVDVLDAYASHRIPTPIRYANESSSVEKKVGESRRQENHMSPTIRTP